MHTALRKKVPEYYPWPMDRQVLKYTKHMLLPSSKALHTRPQYWGLLWSHYLCPPKCLCWILTTKVMVLEGLWREDLVMKAETSWMRINVLIKKPGENPHSLPCKDSGRRSSINQQMCLFKTLNRLAPWPWTYQLPEPWEIHFHCLEATQFRVYLL